MKRILLIITTVLSLSVTAQERVNPVWSIAGGFNIAQLDNYGFECMAGYYPYSNQWFRIAPKLQVSYFFSPERKWLASDDKISGNLSEFRGNVLVAMEFSPSIKTSFYIGLAPYVGFQSFWNKGSIYNPGTPLDEHYDYSFTTYDFGLRVELGGYIGKSQRHGLEGHLQFSWRPLLGENPRVHLLTISSMDYKAYVGLSYIYRIQ